MPGIISIPTRSGFLKARSAGIKAVSRGIVVQAVPSGRKDWRLGITASKKIGNAVRRNRARRRLRALARHVLVADARDGIDYVLIARFETGDRPWDHLIDDLTKALGYLHRKLANSDAKAGKETG